MDVTTKGRVTIGTVPTLSAIEVTLLQGQTSISLAGVVADPSPFFSRLYLGMPVSGSGLATGTTVAGFDAVSQEVSLSYPVAESSPRDPNYPGLRTTTAVTFGSSDVAADRNVVRDNDRGIVLSDGIHSILNTDVSGNTRSGIVIAGVSQELPNESHQVGSLAASGSGYGNTITANGGYGILLASDAVFNAADELNRVNIEGNNFAGTTENTQGSIGRRTLSGGVLREEAFAGLDFAPNPFTGIDQYNNRHYAASGNLPVPSAPQNFVATLGADRVDLSWAAPADPIDVVEGYAVFSSTSATGPWTLSADYPANQRTASVTGLNAFVPYWFRVLGRNSSGDGAAEIVGPLELTGLPAGSLSVSAVVPPDGTIDLAWTYNPASSSSAEVTGYDIYQRLPADEWPQVPIATGVTGTTLTVDAGLVPGLSYQFRVVATNDTGDGAEANSAVVTPRVPADPPTGVSAIAGDTAATVFWTPPVSSGGTAITDYRVQFSTNDGVTWQNFTDGPGTDPQTTVGNLTNGLFYRFRVAAVTASGTLLGEWSTASLPVQPVGESAAPTDVTATPVVENGGNAIDVSWTAPTQTGGLPVQGYSLQYALFVEGGTPDWQTYSGNLVIGTQARVDGLINGKAYVFQVAAVTAQGTGDFSVPTAPATARGELLGPVNLQSSSTQTAITLAWDEPADGYGAGTAVNYEVEISLGGQSMTKLTNGARWTTFSGLPEATTGS
ncbi:MAG: hypothetical protein EBU59_07070 [Planctomycetia bacterium]|nr:hypothetical protein [Planctomycetia bacterium]